MRRLLTAALFSVLANAGVAQEYRCNPWTPAREGIGNISDISIGQRMAVVKAAGQARTTIRMFYGTLTHRTFADDTSVLIAHGDPAKRADGTPGFGPRIALQRLYHDPDSPTLVQTTCEATQ